MRAFSQPIRSTWGRSLLLLAAGFFWGPGVASAADHVVEASSPTTVLAGTMSDRWASVSNAARPELIVTGDSVYVFSLETPTSNPTFTLRVYDRDLNLKSGPAVVAASMWGNKPTDIRVQAAPDRQSAYAFFEIANQADNTSSLWGARYALDGRGTLMAQTQGPVTTGPYFYSANVGDVLMDDPAPLVMPNGKVFVGARLKANLGDGGKATARIFPLTENLASAGAPIDIDLSSAIRGGMRQYSLLAQGDRIWMAVPSALPGAQGALDVTVPAEIKTIVLSKDWSLLGNSTTIAGTTDSNETYSVGFAPYGSGVALVYRAMGLSGGSPVSSASMLALLGDKTELTRLETTQFPSVQSSSFRIPRSQLGIAPDGTIYTGVEDQSGYTLFRMKNLR